MRRILNLFITGLILWAASQLFPSIVQIDSFKTLALASLLLWLVELAITVICVIILVIGAVCENIFWVVASIIALFFAQVIALGILSSTLNGFMVIGFWPKVLLSLCYSLLSLSEPSTSDNNNSAQW